MAKQEKILVAHQFDGVGGSAQVARLLCDRVSSYASIIVMCGGSSGVLSDAYSVEKVSYHPSLSPKTRFLDGLKYVASQYYFFFRSIQILFRHPEIKVIVNACLPIGVCFAARLLSRDLTCYLHEYPVGRTGMDYIQRFNISILKRMRIRWVVVSNYLAKRLDVRDAVVIPNSSPNLNETEVFRDRKFDFPLNIVFFGQDSDAKGATLFLDLVSHYRDDKRYIFTWKTTTPIRSSTSHRIARQDLKNLKVDTGASSVSGYLNRADVVLVLTDPRRAIETFSLVTLEAMSYGAIPITPGTGGHLDFLKNRVNGYTIGHYSVKGLVYIIEGMRAADLVHVSVRAKQTSKNYGRDSFNIRMDELLKEILE